METNKPIPVKVDLYWAFLNEPNQLSEKYQVDLCNLSKEAVKKLMEIGIDVKNDVKKPDQGFFVTAKSKLYPILAVDEKGIRLTLRFLTVLKVLPSSSLMSIRSRVRKQWVLVLARLLSLNLSSTSLKV